MERLLSRTGIEIITLAVAFAVTYSGCGNSSTPAADSEPVSAESSPGVSPITTDLAAALAEVENAPAPSGIDAALFSELRTRLIGDLKQAADANTYESITGADNQVTDLVARGNYYAGWRLEWSYVNRGDYDLNSEVNVADLAPIGRYFGVTHNDSRWAMARRADGNGNGVVDIADVTPIGEHYFCRISSYNIYCASAPSGAAGGGPVPESSLLLGSVEFTSALRKDIGNEFRFDLPSSVPQDADCFWVEPTDGYRCGTASNYAFRPTGNDWSMFGHDARHTRRSPFLGAQTSNLRWSRRLGAVIYCSPTIGPDGTIYVGCYDNKLYAFSAGGEEKWTFAAQHRINSCPAIAADGCIYFGSRDGNIYALNPDGSLKWTYATGANVKTSPVFDADGNLYLGSWDNNFYAFEPDGTLRWVYPTEGWIRSSAAIGGDGTIYVGSEDDFLHAVNPDGSRRWAYRAEGDVISSPAIADDGTIYVGSLDQCLHAVNPDGSRKWTFRTDDKVVSSPAIADDGTIFVGSSDMHFYAIHPDGTLYWKFATQDVIGSSPSIGADGTVYVGCHDGNLYAFNPGGGLKWKYDTGYWIMASPAIAADGTVYVAGYSHLLYAFGPPADTE